MHDQAQHSIEPCFAGRGAARRGAARRCGAWPVGSRPVPLLAAFCLRWQLAEMLQSTDFWYAHAYVRVCSLIERDSPELLRTKSTCAAPPRNLSLRLCKLRPYPAWPGPPGQRVAWTAAWQRHIGHSVLRMCELRVTRRAVLTRRYGALHTHVIRERRIRAVIHVFILADGPPPPPPPPRTPERRPLCSSCIGRLLVISHRLLYAATHSLALAHRIHPSLLLPPLLPPLLWWADSYARCVQSCRRPRTLRRRPDPLLTAAYVARAVPALRAPPRCRSAGVVSEACTASSLRPRPPHSPRGVRSAFRMLRRQASGSA